MNGPGEILLLADGAVRDRLSSRLEGALNLQSDPYLAMEALARTPCRAVVLTAPRPELPSLCRALRRLAPQTKLLALSSVAAEPEVRSLLGRDLDDYFIYPPTREDIAAIHRLAGINGHAKEPPAAQAVSPKPAASNGNVPAPAGLLLPREINRLLETAVNTPALEAGVAELVAARLGQKVRWADAAQNDAEPLLVAAGEPPRALTGPPPQSLTPDDRQFLDNLRQLLDSLLSAARRTEALHRLAITDHLTGAYNRRYFYHLTDHILRQAKASKFRVTLLLYDIDDFKHYNETYGHAAGDEILRETAMLMKRTSRSHDVVARIGGDEFAALFWDVQPPRRPTSKQLESFQRLAERFRRAVSNHSFASFGPEATGVLTISGGLANFPADGETCRDLLRAADQALRQVKRSGKNGIQLIGE